MQLKETKAAARELLSDLPIRKPRKLKRSDISLIIISLICALILWVYIALAIKTETTPKFYNLPVTADMTNTKASGFGLQLLPESLEEINSMTADCTLVGNRAAIGGLKRSDIEVYVDFNSDVTDIIGKQTLPIKVRTKNGAQFTSAEVTPNTITVNMDRYTKKDIPVSKALYPNLTKDNETIIPEDEFTYSPSKIEVSGPSRLLAELDHICVNINDSEKLIETKTFDCGDFTFMDAADKPLTNSEGTPLDSSVFTMSANRFSVTIPVRYSLTMPIGIEITGVPEGFDIETVYQRLRIIGNSQEYSLPGYGEENMQIRIETSDPEKKANLDNRASYNLQGIPLADLIPGKAIDAAIPIAQDYSYPDNITSVKVKLDQTDLITETRWIKNSDIELQNTDNRYHYALKSPEGNTQITLCGKPEDLAKIETKDLKAYVNLISETVTKEGEYTPDITVTLPKTVSSVWVANPQVGKPPTLAMNITVAG